MCWILLRSAITLAAVRVVNIKNKIQTAKTSGFVDFAAVGGGGGGVCACVCVQFAAPKSPSQGQTASCFSVQRQT